MTTASQAAMTLLTITVDAHGDSARRLDLLTRTIDADLADCETVEARDALIIGMLAQLATVAAGLARAVADFHGIPVADYLARLAAIAERTTARSDPTRGS